MSDKKMELGQVAFVVEPEVVAVECPNCDGGGALCSTCNSSGQCHTTKPVVQEAQVFGIQTCELVDEPVHRHYTLKRETAEGEVAATFSDQDVHAERPNLDEYCRCGGCSGWGLVPILGGQTVDECHNCSGRGYVHEDQVADKKQAQGDLDNQVYKQYNAPTDVN
jgi:hypothetical protein